MCFQSRSWWLLRFFFSLHHNHSCQVLTLVWWSLYLSNTTTFSLRGTDHLLLVSPLLNLSLRSLSPDNLLVILTRNIRVSSVVPPFPPKFLLLCAFLQLLFYGSPPHRWRPFIQLTILFAGLKTLVSSILQDQFLTELVGHRHMIFCTSCLFASVCVPPILVFLVEVSSAHRQNNLQCVLL